MGRTRLACDLLAQYLPPDILVELLASYEYVLDTPKCVGLNNRRTSFTRLDTHVKALQRQQLNIPADTSTSKKTKKRSSVPKESNKRQKKASQGVQNLSKSNVDGMAKLSTFFSKKAP